MKNTGNLYRGTSFRDCGRKAGDSYVFGKGPKERKSSDPRCMRDALAEHVDDLKALCEELIGISQGLGV